MILYCEEGQVVAAKSRRPRFKDYAGRTWDSEVKEIDGKRVEFFFDTSWGRNFYFELEKQWYRAPIFMGTGRSERLGVGDIVLFYTKSKVAEVANA